MQLPTLIDSLDEYLDWIIETLPKQGRWTEKEYLWLTDETKRLVEFTDGFLEPLPVPTDKHQTALGFLFILLTGFLRPIGGKAHPAGIRLRIRRGKFREADITALKDAKDRRRRERFWTGADLVVEVVSKDDPRRDLVKKRRDYAEGRIPEYWIVNPLDETITVLKRQRGAYVEHGVFRRGSSASSVVLPGFSVSVDEVFDAD